MKLIHLEGKQLHVRLKVGTCMIKSFHAQVILHCWHSHFWLLQHT